MYIDVEYNDWNRWYEKILNDFNFNQDEDEKSAQILNNTVDKKYDDKIRKKKAIIIGAGPSIEKHVQYIKKHVNIDEYITMAADGATTYLLSEDIVPDVIVTDLDGRVDDIIDANKKGSILYVHAHGDNITQIKKYIPLLNRVIPTTQSNPYGNLENYGGFTDGDRAIHIAVYKYKVEEIILAGMDFGKMVTRFSRPNINNKVQKADNFKEKKLQYAQKLTQSLIDNNSNIKFINLLNQIK